MVKLLNNYKDKLSFKDNIETIAHHISIVPPPRMGLINRRSDMNSGISLSEKDIKKYDKDKSDVNIDDSYIDNIISSVNSELEKEFTVEEIGYNDKAIAVKVSSSGSEFKTLFQFLHVTLAIPIGGSAKDSNSITDWERIPNNFTIKGTLKIIK